MTTVLGFAEPRFTLPDASFARPLSAMGESPGVLAIHGFTGVPHEVGVLVEAAKDVGLRALAPMLPGHGTDARDLQTRSFRDWVRAAEEGLEEVAAKGPVILSDMSLGSVIAAHLAARHGQRVRGLVLLGFAGWLPRLTTAWPLEAIRLLGLHQRDLYLPKLGGADIADENARAVHPSYDVHPIRAAIELTKLARMVRAELGRITCPTLVMHGRHDKVCPHANVSRLVARLGSRDIETITLENSAHIITVDRERHIVRDRARAFFRRLARDT